jgi:hypothetical protein
VLKTATRRRRCSLPSAARYSGSRAVGASQTQDDSVMMGSSSSWCRSSSGSASWCGASLPSAARTYSSKAQGPHSLLVLGVGTSRVTPRRGFNALVRCGAPGRPWMASTQWCSASLSPPLLNSSSLFSTQAAVDLGKTLERWRNKGTGWLGGEGGLGF